jgi:hypothetical protein
MQKFFTCYLCGLALVHLGLSRFVDILRQPLGNFGHGNGCMTLGTHVAGFKQSKVET